jgi:uncharacterized protein YabE (DUF348 family)
MTDHLRQRIREQVATTVTGLATTGSNVFQSRVYSLSDDVLPALLVYSVSESSDIDSMGSIGSLTRNLSLSIEGYVKNVSDYDDVIDDVCKEVEIAMAGDKTLNGLAQNSYLAGTDINYNGEGEQPVGIVTMNYVIQYRTATNAPETAL